MKGGGALSRKSWEGGCRDKSHCTHNGFGVDELLDGDGGGRD